MENQPKSNMEIIIAQFSRAFNTIPFNEMLGLTLDELRDDHAVISFNMKQELIGNFLHGILHGGVISSVLDMAGGTVVMSGLVKKHPFYSLEDFADIASKCSTIDLQISFLRPGKGERFIAKAWLVKSGHKISFTRMELYNQENVLIATGSGTYVTG